ncbi:MAG TPA: NADH-quinone oxidoreductase subunit A [Spirochaetia bacterium]|nr:NADH-quinone oxidoreductase subunit A [Spirochaetia bacterium]
MSALLSLAGYLVVVIALVGFLMVVTHVSGERHSQRGTGAPYESGEIPTGSARLRFSADFYLVAMFFVIFDISAVFLFAWAVAARDLGWIGYGAIVVFMIETVAGLAYLWRRGAFDWGARRLREHRERHGVGSAR